MILGGAILEKRMTRSLSILFACLLFVPPTLADTDGYQLDADNVEGLADAMPVLAEHLLQDYEASDRETYLNNLFRLQLLAGHYGKAIESIEALRELRKKEGSALDAAAFLQYEIFANAMRREAIGDVGFESAFHQAFRESFTDLTDHQAFHVAQRLVYRTDVARRQLQAALEKQGGNERIRMADAMDLVRTYQPYSVYRRILQLTPELIAEVEEHRYEIESKVLIETDYGITLSAVVVRPKRFSPPQPTAFAFNIYSELSADLLLAKLAAAHGYIGVVADARGKRLSPDKIEPYEHEAKDTHAVLDWIIKQPWSNGEVGMFGGSYLGFAAWAALKDPHPALKTIAPAAAAIPGLGLPMYNNVFLNANYCWAFHVTNNKTLDRQVCHDHERWQRMEDQWYQSGRPYRDIDDIDGTPNPWLQRWLDHPSYDEYWQAMVPYEEEFADIEIPVLTMTGYFDDGQVSALHYLSEHYAYRPDAENYLIIGPYGHWGVQWGSAAVFRGYRIDPVARINPPEIVFRWFDYVLRGGEKPELLEDKINYQVMGANIWRHVPSLDDIGTGTLRLYLNNTKSDGHHMLSRSKPTDKGTVRQVVDFADRETTSFNAYPSEIVLSELDTQDALVFISKPFEEPVEVSGAFSGQLVATINKQDMDVVVALYERMPDGRYFYLSYYLGRASYAKDMTERNLLEPGAAETIPIKRSYMTSRRLQEGSRLVVVLDINKSPWAQINYGTGADVSAETSEDAEQPLIVNWHNDSYIEVKRQ